MANSTHILPISKQKHKFSLLNEKIANACSHSYATYIIFTYNNFNHDIKLILNIKIFM
jgi:hypothetical protein